MDRVGLLIATIQIPFCCLLIFSVGKNETNYKVQQRHAAPEKNEKWLRPAVNKLLPCVHEFRRKKSNAVPKQNNKMENKLSNRIAKESIGGVSLKISSL